MANYTIYNGFWNPETIPDPVRRLVAAAAQHPADAASQHGVDSAYRQCRCDGFVGERR